MPSPSTADLWIHLAEVTLGTILLPVLGFLLKVIIGLRDATRDLSNATANIKETIEDHERRIRYIELTPHEQRFGGSGYDRRRDVQPT